MTARSLVRHVTLAAVATSSALVLTAGPALGAAASVGTFHDSFDPVGAVFTCGASSYTVTGGSVSNVFHFTVDPQGITHVTGTLVPHAVTLTDGQGGSYALSGASWFGGKASGPDGNDLIVATDTEHFVLRNATGGVVGKVSLVEHISPNGKVLSVNAGTCLPPQN